MMEDYQGILIINKIILACTKFLSNKYLLPIGKYSISRPVFFWF